MNKKQIAIIGMSVRAPGADNLDQYWDMISTGKDSFKRLDAEALSILGKRGVPIADPHYVPVHSSLNNPFDFDAEFFGCTPAEARLMDPQHRIFLEQAHAALEDAGINSINTPHRIGLVAGAGVNWYREQGVDSTLSQDQYFQKLYSEEKDHLVLRVSYKLNLRGPVFVVQSACSTSLLAVHVAANFLRLEEADIMLAGGINVRLEDSRGYVAEEGGVLASDGLCRPFESDSCGTVWASGAGIVVLKPLDKAIEDRDHVYAVIEGSAVGNDGKHKVGYSASAASSQEDVMRDALKRAGISQESVRYVEAHGTGTVLGDAIEVAALTDVYGRSENIPNCQIGSIKANLGHPEGASGILGLIRAALAISKDLVPNHRKWKQERSELADGKRGLQLAGNVPEALEWGADNYLAVHSLGLGGTNVHMILGAFKLEARAASLKLTYPFLFSAERVEDLALITQRLDTFLENHPTTPLRDIAYTLAIGRRHFRIRAALCADSREGLQAALKQLGQTGSIAKGPLSHNTKCDLIQADRLNGWIEGESITWQEVFSIEKCQKVSLPSYPFRRIPYVKNVTELNKTQQLGNQIEVSGHSQPAGTFSAHDVEQSLLHHVSQILGINDVTTESDFINLGGDSLLATQVISRLRKEMGIKISIRAFLQAPTLGAIANQAVGEK